jgi:cytochrome c-type biogenesis protein CcmH
MSRPATPTSPPPPPLDAAGQARLRALSEELRCLVCQNQTLADSNADLAIDLRNQVQELIASGRTDTQIKDYLVERYGDFVLYKPPMQRNTALLWGGPFALLAGGALVWTLVQRRSRLAAEATGSDAGRTAPLARAPETARPVAPTTAPVTAPASELERARRLLDD